MLCIYKLSGPAYKGFHGHGIMMIHDWTDCARPAGCRSELHGLGGEQEPDDILEGGDHPNIEVLIRYGASIDRDSWGGITNNIQVLAYPRNLQQAALQHFFIKLNAHIHPMRLSVICMIVA